ncbi:MAG: hypothetical protein KKB03_02760 [Nanoarchaeota archaeon]|nr:hypothetical protein [Nanoarchaeota archaeon]
MVVSDKLIDYIKEQLKEGHKPNVIRDVLLDAGYYVGDIEEAFGQIKSEMKVKKEVRKEKEKVVEEQKKIEKKVEKEKKELEKVKPEEELPRPQMQKEMEEIDPEIEKLKAEQLKLKRLKLERMRIEKLKAEQSKFEEHEIKKLKMERKQKPAILIERAKIGFFFSFMGSILIFLNSIIQILLIQNFFEVDIAFFPFTGVEIFVPGLILVVLNIILGVATLGSSFAVYKRGTEHIGGSLVIILAAIAIIVSNGFILGPLLAIAGGIAGIAKK